MQDEKQRLVEKEEHLHEELNNVKIQLIALGQSLMGLGYYLKENPVQILLIGCDIDNPNPKCAEFTMDFKELTDCPQLITRLLQSFHKLQGELDVVREKLEEYGE